MPDSVADKGLVAASKGGLRGWLAMAALFVAIVALRGAALLFDHSLHSIDGAMQTWFALDNFADGAKLGDEFQSYLGISMILALLPGFFAFGQTLWASTFVASMMVIAGAFAGAYAIVWMMRGIPRSQRWWIAILLAFVFYYAGGWVVGATGYGYPATFDPGVSLRPLRGALPFFVLPVFVLAVRAALSGGAANAGLVPGFVLGLAAGVGLLWSNDAGIPLVIALVIGLIAALHQRLALLFATSGAFLVGGLLSSLTLLMAVTHGDPSGWFQYNFIDVPADQFWYFGPWSPEARVLSIMDLPRIFIAGNVLSSLSLIVLTLCVLYAGLRRIKGRGSPVRMGAFVFVGSSVIGTALLPQIGGHIGFEYKAITFVLGMCAPVIVFQRQVFALAKPLVTRMPSRAFPAAAGFAALTMILFETGSLITTTQATDRTVYAEKLGFYVTPQTAEDLAAIERLSLELERRGYPRDQRLLSVYTSALDIAAGTDSPAPVGSLIHALGEHNRAQFNDLLNGKAVAVTTIAPDYSGWAGWNTRANWSFFKNLRDLYLPVARSDQHILWLRASGMPPKQEANCEVTGWSYGRIEIVVEGTKTGLASLYLEREAFDGSARTAALTVTEDSPFTRSVTQPQWGDFPRYGVPNSTVVELSVPVQTGETSRLSLEVMDGSAIGFADCHAAIYQPIDFAALPSFSEGIDRRIAGADQ